MLAVRKKLRFALFSLVCLSGCTKAGERDKPVTKEAQQVDRDKAHRQGLDNASAMVSNASECEPGEGPGVVDACQRACELNHSNSCANWGAFVETEDTSRARRLYARACKGGSGIGCEALARMSAEAGEEEAPAHYLGARRYHRVHCAQGYARSCSQLAALLEAGVGGDADPKTGRMFHQRACLLGRSDDCSEDSVTPQEP